MTIDAEGRDSANGADPGRLLPELRPGRYVRLTVRDDGSGIEPELHERIFEPFFTTKGTCTGLGLATVSEVLREARGAVRIETGPGVGSSFHPYISGVSRHPTVPEGS